MFRAKIERFGDELGIRIPDSIVQSLNLVEGDEFVVQFNEDRIYLELVRVKAERLREALDHCNEEYGETLRRLAEE